MAVNIKSYKEHYKRQLYSGTEREAFFRELIKNVSLGHYERMKALVEVLKKEGQLQQLSKYRENDGETVLHIATKFNQSSEIIEYLIQTFPELMYEIRSVSDEYYGQTPLHVAIAKGNIDAVDHMLSKILDSSQKSRAALLHQLATGTKFVNTVMMGELPLSVAAMTFNLDMIDSLIQGGAEMDRINTKGDTVFHSLIRFAAIYPEHTNNVLFTMQHLHKHIVDESSSEKDNYNMLSMEYDKSYIWFVTNHDDLNPLQLSAALSQSAIFQYILGLPQVYCFLNNHDGLFDRKLYDITEIDTMATEKWSSDQRKRRFRLKRHIAPSDADGISKQSFKNTGTSCNTYDTCSFCLREQKKSILEMMFDIKYTSAFEFLQLSTLRNIVKSKWMHYRMFYYTWMVLHFLFMVALTVYAVQKANHDDADNKLGSQSTSNNTTLTPNNTDKARQNFIFAWSIVYFVVGLLYLLQEIVHLLFRSKTFNISHLTNILHNSPYRFILFLFSVNLIIDFILEWFSELYENYCLMISLITGWWFLVFFLRAQKKFSFFTVMIQKVIFGDFLRFSIIIVIVLVSFTTAMYMTFKGSVTEDLERHSFGGMMLMLFRLMLGLGEIDELYKARQPWLAVTLFIMFVLLTYVLMFNALIAMMSQTCTIVSENRHVQWRIQQLSVILFFEGVLPYCLQKSVGIEKHVKRFDPNIKQVIKEKRYYLDISSLHTEYANAEDIYNLRHKLQTLPLTDPRPYLPSFMMTTLNNTIIQDNHIKSPRQIRPILHNTPDDGRYNYDPDNGRDRAGEEPFDAYKLQGKEINVSPAQVYSSNDKDVETPKTPKGSKLKRKKSKRDRVSPTRGGPGNHVNIQAPEDPSYQGPRRRQRVEPEGDYQIDQPNYQDGFQVNRDLNGTYLPIPSQYSPTPQNPGNGGAGRRRHKSANDLQASHIGSQIQPPRGAQTDRQQQLPVEQVIHLARPSSSIDIGVIEDSYM